MNINQVSVQELEASKFGGKGGNFAQVKTRIGEKLRIQTPILKVPFDIHPTYKTLNLNATNEKFAQFIRDVEDWASYQDGVDGEFVSCLKQSNPMYPPTFRTKVDDTTSFYNDKKERKDQSVVQRGCFAHAIIELKFIYKMQGKWGLSWRVLQVLVHSMEEEETPKEEYSFLD